MNQFALVLRSLTKSWIFSSTVIVLLACGIGITCAVFDLVYSVILRPFPYPEQERLVQIWETSRTREKGPVSLPDYEDMRRNQRTLEDAALMQNNSANVVWNGSPIPVPVHYFKAALFNVLKLNPILGRTFSEQEEHESKPVALVSEQFWKKRLDSRSDAVGQQLQIDARTFTIVGILPNTIKELWPGDIFMPMSFNPRLGLYLENREAYGFWSIGRLRPGVTIARANADLGAISSELARRFPKTNSDIKFEVVPLSDRFHRLYDGTMWLLGGASLCMLGIVYASVSNVMVARVLGRSSEFALKMSLGATKLQVFRELLLESVVLVLAATFIGLVINYLLVGSLQHFGPPDVFRFHSVGAGGVPIVVAAAAALASSIAISLLPFLTLQSSTLSTRLRGGDQRVASDSQVHHGSVVAGIILQIALATALVTNGAIVVRTVLRLQDAPLGLNPKHLLAFSVALPSAQYDTPEKCKVFEERFAREASELGALESISYNDIPPLVDIGPRQSDFQIVGQNPREPAPKAYWQDVGADYFKVMEIPLKRGRLLTQADIANKVSVTVIDEQLAAEFFPGEDPIGKQIGDDTPLTIVGVVGSSKHGSYAGGREFYQIYYNNLPDVGRPMWFLAKAKGDPWAVVRDLQNVLSSINLDLAMFNVSTMEDILGNTLRTHRLVETIVSIFACFSFALALVGLYGVVAAAMARREMELAIRMALGATPNKILMLILRNFLVVLSLGLCAGALLAVAADKLMQSLPARLGNFEPITCALVCIALGLASTIAGLIPCRRIAQIQPASLLRG